MALEALQLTAGYGERDVLHGVNLTLQPGMLMCLLGPNGSGKSTFVRALCGVLPAGSGHVQLEQTDILRLSPAARARHIGFLPQEVQPGFSFSVEEAVELGVRCAGNRGEDPIRNALQQVDAVHLMGRRLDHLSGGERRRVLLASVLAQAPRYLLLDEPTAMLDLEHQVALFERLAQLSEEMGILVVTHDVNLAAQWASHIVLLKDGRITATGPPDEVMTREQLQPVFGSRFDLIQTPSGKTAVVPR